MMKRICFLLLLLFSISCSQNPKDNLVTFTGFTMGTTYSIKIVKTEGQEIEYKNLQVKIDEVLKKVNMSMSTFIDSSEISLFNKSKANKWFSISGDLSFVMLTAKKISELSNGAFDITVGPLVNLWGFGHEQTSENIPSDSSIDARKKNIGFAKIHFNSLKNKIKKDLDGMYCDLAAIAKGFGVDKVGEFLEEMGIKNYLVEIGGEIRTRGKNHKNETWKIGIAAPDANSGLQQVIPLENMAMATSGDYQNYFEKNGVRYSHTINPITGRPITHKLASVTVIYENCMTADAVATAIDVLGPDKGMELAKKMDVAVYMIIRSENGFIEKMNSKFEKYFEK